MNLPPAPQILATAIVIFLAIGLHEYAHAKTADMAGDPTPRLMGRVTFDLTKHFELLGTIMIIFTSLSGFGIGWGKPVMVDPNKMRNPRWDHFWSVAAGPLSNLMQAGVFAIILRLTMSHQEVLGALAGVMSHQPQASFLTQFYSSLLVLGILVNLSLAFFNLIPFGPLDGHWLIGSFMSPMARQRWYHFSHTQGSLILLMLILFGQMSSSQGGPSFIGMIIGPPVRFCFGFLTGIYI